MSVFECVCVHELNKRVQPVATEQLHGVLDSLVAVQQ